MKQVKEIVSKFKTSRPIFRLAIDPDKLCISSYTKDPLHKFYPEAVPNCAVTSIANNEYNEYFSLHNKAYTIDRDSIIRDAVRAIRYQIVLFLNINLDMKNPSQSKVYKWADRSMPHTDEFNEVICSLYKYLRTFCDEDMRSSNIADRPKVINIIALLEAMQEKYGKR